MWVDGGKKLIFPMNPIPSETQKSEFTQSLESDDFQYSMKYNYDCVRLIGGDIVYLRNATEMSKEYQMIELRECNVSTFNNNNFYL